MGKRRREMGEKRVVTGKREKGIGEKKWELGEKQKGNITYQYNIIMQNKKGNTVKRW